MDPSFIQRQELSPMIYLLGGPPRVGKSIIAATMTQKHGFNVVSTDSLGAVLESVVDPEAEPGLFAITRFNEMAEADRIRLMLENPGERIDYQLDESRAVWKAVAPFIMSEQEEGRSVVIEGVAVLPAHVHQLAGVATRAMFIGNQGEHHGENMRRSAQQNAHDWMRAASDAYIDAFATFVVQMSRYIEREAHKYGFQYLEMDNEPFDVAVRETVDALLH